jgi:heat shock protein HtpX
MKTCPGCGYESNSDTALMCGLCGEVFPEAAQRIEREHPPLYPFRTDFAEEIRNNRLNSIAMMIGFPFLLGMVGLAFGIFFGLGMWGVFGALAIAVILIIFAYYEGDRTILDVSGARLADPQSEGQLINIVDEMRIAGGLPMPKVYVIESDSANAFATGLDPDRASVCVTTGLLATLNREELQGVIAHEMSHVRNFDIRYMLLIAAMVGAIILLSDLFRRGMWFGGGRGLGRDRGKFGGPYLAIIALIFALLAPLIAALLQMAVSRKREFLADATGVELTRNPLALASALDKIEARMFMEPLATASKATQHLFIVNPLRSYTEISSPLFSTHPPTQERIRVLKAMAMEGMPEPRSTVRSN